MIADNLQLDLHLAKPDLNNQILASYFDLYLAKPDFNVQILASCSVYISKMYCKSTSSSSSSSCTGFCFLLGLSSFRCNSGYLW